jgi:hypothetical protein
MVCLTRHHTEVHNNSSIVRFIITFKIKLTNKGKKTNMSWIDTPKKNELTKLCKSYIPFIILRAHTCLLINVATLTSYDKNILQWIFLNVTNA